MTRSCRFIALLIVILVPAKVSFAQERRNYPIPTFANAEQNLTSNALQSAMEAMAEHLCRRQDPPSSGWQSRYDELLTEMIVAEHAVVWAAAADFASDERIQLGNYYKEKDALLRLLERLIPDNPALRAPADKLRSGGDSYTNTAASAKFGRGIFTVYALRTLLADVHRDSWQTMASIQEGPDYNRLMKRALNVLGEVQFRLYIRGMQIVDQKTAGAEFEFAVHQSPDNLRDTIEAALVQKFLRYSGVRGANAQRVTEFDKEIPWQRLGGLYPVRFEGPIRTQLAGPCFRPTVRILYQTPRKADAEAAEELLRRNNFEVEMVEFRQDAVLSHKNKVYYQNRGSRAGAESIGEILKKLEVLNAVQGIDSQPSGSSDYSVWIAKKPEPKPNQIRVNYTAERRSDAERAIARLQAAGYTVTFETIGYEESRSGQLLYRTGRGATGGEASEIARLLQDIEPLTPAMNSGATERIWPPYDIWIVAKRDDTKIDLSGTWLGYNYNCPGDSSIQEIRITHFGTDVVGIKISGNRCIGDGEVTFRARVAGGVMTGEMHERMGTDRVFTKVKFEIRNKDLIVMNGSIELRRKKTY